MKVNTKPLKKSDIFSYWIVLVIVIFLITHCTRSQDSQAGNLVTAKWLEKNISNKDLLILDASTEKVYNEGHITGAVNVNVYMFGVMETPVKMMEELFQSIGVSGDKIIVIYDQGGAILAPRLFYSLFYHGFPADKLFILDGGFSKWKENYYPVTKEIPRAVKGDFMIKEKNENARVMLDEFLSATGDTKNNALIEALETDWHYGKTQFFNRGGHIPNVLSYPASDFFNEDKTFKSPEEIKKMLAYYGVNSSQKIMTHCGGGVAAAVPFFVFKFILGYDNVKLFMESQMGWLKDERDLPFWTYDKPYLLRGSSWLNTWGGEMMRRYGIAAVSIIDIRSEAEYNSGHLPYSVNIPASEFIKYLSKPNELAVLLGSCGVNINNEAVIFSGEGLTGGSSLAFALIKSLGQKSVSIFTDNLNEFQSKGFKPEINVKKPESKAYNYLINDEVFINENSAKGLFDEVYILSGEMSDINEYQKNAIQLDYNSFLTSNGTPKEAKDIWDIMNKAGVPRYARIICYSKDPGESAINYFIFKLMGYPDVKIKL